MLHIPYPGIGIMGESDESHLRSRPPIPSEDNERDGPDRISVDSEK